MIISEKQIHALLKFLRDFIKEMKKMKLCNGIGLTEAGDANLDDACKLLMIILNQQCKELKEIE